MKSHIVNQTGFLASDIKAMSDELLMNTFFWLLFTTDVIQRYLDVMLRQYPIGRTGFAILNSLVTHNGTMKPSDISRLVFRSNNTITRAVDNLEKHGLVKRELGRRDRRIRSVTITMKGLALLQNELPNIREIGSIAISFLGTQEIAKLNTLLKQVAKHLLCQIELSSGKQPSRTENRKEATVS